MSGIWWQRVVAESQAWYSRWVHAPAVERGLIRPTQSSELQDLRYRRLESRAYAMLQSAVPTMIRDELIANREVHCVALVFHVQPGGLQERASLLEALTNPGTSNTAADAVAKLRAWGRALNRAASMGISIPDASLMLRGVDNLSEQILRRHVHVNFRINQARNYLQLDHYPTLQAVKEYTKIVQSEFDMLAISGHSSESGPKKPRPKLAAMQQGAGKGKQGGAGAKEGKPGEHKGKSKGGDSSQDTAATSTAEGKNAAKGEGKPCSFYLTPKGCSKGRQCTFSHQFGKAKGESRCYNCGSLEHRQDNCTRPTGKGQAPGQPKGRGQKGSSSTPAAGQSSEAAASSQGSTNATSSGSNANKSVGESGATAPGGVPDSQASSRHQGSLGSSQNVANAQAQVLEEAQKLLKSLRIAALRVHEGAGVERVDREESNYRDGSPERIVGSPVGVGEGPREDRPSARQVGVESESEIFVS